MTARGFSPATVAMDMGYDHNRIYAECAERNCTAIIPLRKGQKERDLRIPRGTDEWRSLYRRRSAVEREFGRLKHNYGLAFLRVRGIERVRLHADLTILGRLALELAKARLLSRRRLTRATFPVMAERPLLHRIHNPTNYECGCDPDCWCRRTVIGRAVKWWFPARWFGIRHKNSFFAGMSWDEIRAWKREQEAKGFYP